MDKKTARTMSSPCGLPCFHCPAYLARENPMILEKLVEGLGLSPDNATCEGCRPQQGLVSFLDAKKTCEIYLCTEAKGIDFCNECDDFPCKRFQPYADQAHYPHNMKMYQLCMMKKLGLEEWATEKAVEIWETYRMEPFSFDNIRH